jgi:2-polyprenyl-6-hydroxyphenyl methylase/3-demethylubiquinone-9 3-methyltransferase
MRFKFGNNWQSYAKGVGTEEVTEAERSLTMLLGCDLTGRRFLDIGSGSGLFSLAARRLGAKVVSFDYDADSVACTENLRAKYRPDDPDWRIERGSILDDAYVAQLGQFDIVYSWGVLHHTGAMWSAVDKAASLVAPGGLLAIALYRRTPLCQAWHIEKRFYANAPVAIQAVIRGIYIVAYFSGLMLRGYSPIAHVKNYKSLRGMDFWHNTHDWLGGYPYESVRPNEVCEHLTALGFIEVRSIIHKTGFGLFGTGCDEYVWKNSR